MTNSREIAPSFSILAGRLLQGGIAPRHVRRTVAELQDHYFDLQEAALHEGFSQFDAEAEALSRLGKADDLVAEILSKGELRSWSSRWPWLFYGLTPAVASFLVTALFVMFSILPAGVLEMVEGDAVPAAIPPLVSTGIFIAINILPLVVATFFCYQATLRRDPLLWPIAGLTLLCLVAVAFHFRLGWPTPELKGSLSVSLGYPMRIDTFVRAIASVGFIALSMAWFRAKLNR